MDITSSIELVNKINKLKKVKVQRGGVFSLISAIGGVYGYVVELVIRIIKAVMYFLFIPKDVKMGKVPDKEKEPEEYEKYSKSSILKQLYIEYIPKFEAPAAYANFWKFIWFSIMSGVYISVGFLGGILVSLVGIIYMYANLIKEFFSMTPQTDDN